MNDHTTERGRRFKIVAAEVFRHVQDYTVPEYGDYPNDRLTRMDEHDCFHDIEKYLARRKGNERAPGQHRQDVLKMIHLLSEIWLKMGGE